MEGDVDHCAPHNPALIRTKPRGTFAARYTILPNESDSRPRVEEQVREGRKEVKRVHRRSIHFVQFSRARHGDVTTAPYIVHKAQRQGWVVWRHEQLIDLFRGECM